MVNWRTDLNARSGYTPTLPHTRRKGLLNVEGSEETMVVITGKRFSE